MDTETRARETSMRIIIWTIAVEPRFESRDRLYFMAILGWGRSAALSLLLNFLHFWQWPMSSPLIEGTGSLQCLWH